MLPLRILTPLARYQSGRGFPRSPRHMLASGVTVLVVLSAAASAMATTSANNPVSVSKTAALDPPDPKIQRFLRSLLSEDGREMFNGDEHWIREKFDALDEMVGRDRVRLVRQLLHLSMHATEMYEGMLPGVVIEWMGISQRDQALGLLPYLDAANSKLREEALDWLGGIESDPVTDERTFEVYRELLKELGIDSTAPFVRRMYTRDPELAVRTLAEVVAGKDAASQLLDWEISRDAATLRALAVRPEWWIRLYVAAVLKEVPMPEPTLRERLRKDPNPMVREFAEQVAPAATP